MVDRQFSDAALAALYDPLTRPDERADFAFYLPLLMRAGAVLDVGCGTGALLHRARAAGHTGRLCGLDPAEAMLAHARRRPDVEWVLGDLGRAAWDHEFDLVVMTGHAFQVLLSDDELRAALETIRSALVPGGRFAFETRNPAAREWEHWTTDHPIEFADRRGTRHRYQREVETPVTDDLVSFRATYLGPRGARPAVSQSTLRFLDAESVGSRLVTSGFTIEARFGDWDGQPLTAASPEIITVARA
jgi:SAM-dependent methyltransferase